MPEVLKQATKNNKAFWVCLSVSIFLLVGSAIVPPPFVIDSSIFAACGILFGYAALYVLDKAVEKGTPASIKKGEIEVTVGEKKEDNG